MTELVKVYNDGTVELQVEFKIIDGAVYANANSMADSKKLENWKASTNTIRYIEALKNKDSLKSRELIISKRGGVDVGGGTWIHEKLILSLSRYISVEFELWIDEQIATLIREGEVSLVKPSYTIDNPIERAKRWIEEQELHQLEVKAKEEVIVKVTEQVKTKTKMIDDMTKDMDTPLLCKTITDYINILTHRKNETHAQLYTKIYDVLGRRLSKDIIYGKNKYLTAQRQMVNDNIAYNKLHELKGEDRKYPFRMMDARTKLSTLEYIVDVLGEGYLLMETIAKLSEVGIDDVIEKYNYFKTNNINELM